MFPTENNFQCVFSLCVFRVIFSFPCKKIFYYTICVVYLLVFLLTYLQHCQDLSRFSFVKSQGSCRVPSIFLSKNDSSSLI